MYVERGRAEIENENQIKMRKKQFSNLDTKQIKSKKEAFIKTPLFSFSVIPGDPSPLAQKVMATGGAEIPRRNLRSFPEGVQMYVERRRAEIENENQIKKEENAVFQP